MSGILRAFASAAADAASAGRVCPLDYTYAPTVFARQPDFVAETLYVVGGLYGNLAALTAIETLAAAERLRPTIVFNGDFHWFDAEPHWFDTIEQGVAPHRALRGNVETEIARADDIGAGCGCAYPDQVGEDIVRRSNEILAQLRSCASPAARAAACLADASGGADREPAGRHRAWRCLRAGGMAIRA